MKQRIFGIVGWKNSGKTTLVASLVSEFSSRGLSVSTIKHAHHVFDVDQEGTDSSKHRAAGAQEVALVSSKRTVVMRELREEPEPTLEEMLARLTPCDLVLFEGFKKSHFPKVETHRANKQKESPLWRSDPTIRAIATDIKIEDCERRQFSISDIKAIADFISEEVGLSK